MAASIFAIFAGSALIATNAVNGRHQSMSIAANVVARAADAADEVVERLRPADLAGVVPIVGNLTFAESISFQRLSLPGTAPPLPTESLVLESDPADPDDGIDNDGDGLIDELRLVWYSNRGVAGERMRVLANGVTESLEGELPGNLIDDNGNGLVDERGVAFAFRDGRIHFWMTLRRVAKNGVAATRTVERTIALRNTPLAGGQ